MNDKGIDYGLGNTNRNMSTGTRFGVISQHELNPDATEDIFHSGTDLDYADYVDGVRAKLAVALGDYFSDYQHESGRPSRLDQAIENAFDAISDSLGDQYEGTGDCTRMLYEREGYKIQTDSSGDLWVFESPYFTYAQFCSPCAPGACYLANPLDVDADGKPLPENLDNRCYCLGGDWFEDSKAPYPIFSCETGKLISR